MPFLVYYSQKTGNDQKREIKKQKLIATLLSAETGWKRHGNGFARDGGRKSALLCCAEGLTFCVDANDKKICVKWKKNSEVGALMGEKTTQNAPDMAQIIAKIRAEYLNGSDSLPTLSAKHGVALGTLQKYSAHGKWSEKRKAQRAAKAEKISDRLMERDVRQTVKDIERVCRAAGKLIDKVNVAIAQLDKQIYVSQDIKDVVTKEEQLPDGSESLHQKMTRSMRTKQNKTIIDTKRLSDLSKTLLNVKQVLTGEDGSADETESSGIIEIYGQDMIDEHEQDERLATEGEVDGADAARDMEAAAEAGVNASQS